MSILQDIRDWWFARASEGDSILGKGIAIWTQGGWAMVALVIISLFIFFIGFHVFARLLRKRIGGVSEATWRSWIREPGGRRGTVGAIFDGVERVLRAGGTSSSDGFAEMRIREIEPFVRDLRLMNIAVGAAPLVGLLGTVTGMLATFDAMSHGGGGSKTMSMIAKGISEALYTTETGLIVALPGAFLHYFLSRRFERFKKFLAHAETVWAQETLRTREATHQASGQGPVREIAMGEIRERLSERLQELLTTRPMSGA